MKEKLQDSASNLQGFSMEQGEASLSANGHLRHFNKWQGGKLGEGAELSHICLLMLWAVTWAFLFVLSLAGIGFKTYRGIFFFFSFPQGLAVVLKWKGVVSASGELWYSANSVTKRTAVTSVLISLQVSLSRGNNCGLNVYTPAKGCSCVTLLCKGMREKSAYSAVSSVPALSSRCTNCSAVEHIHETSLELMNLIQLSFLKQTLQRGHCKA